MSGLQAVLSSHDTVLSTPNFCMNMSGVTIVPSAHGATPFEKFAELNSNAMLSKVSPDLKYKEIFQSSFDGDEMPPAVQASDNGFVWSAMAAYSDHRHLTLRPDDVWIAILSQLNVYINKHAEELRSLFVAHQGKVPLQVEAHGTRHTVDFGKMAHQMTEEIQKNVVDPELQQWILPQFTTTTKNDIVVMSILMMSTMQKYFDYIFSLVCGIPTVTLLGVKADYEDILIRLDKLHKFGPEAVEFANLLRPVLARFIRSFDNPTDSEVISFWQRIFHKQRQGSGPTIYSGWITAFCFWDQDGNRIEPPMQVDDETQAPLTLDGVTYHKIASSAVPSGWGKVPVLVDDNGDKFNAEMIAGSVGIFSSSKNPESPNLPMHDSVQPAVGWWLYDTGKPV